MKNHFDRIAQDYDKQIPKHIQTHLLKKKSAFMKKRLLAAGKRYRKGLDIGCGTGHYLKKMDHYGYRMTGFDFSKGMVQEAKKQNKGKNINITEGSILKIPHKASQFDFAYTINVMHHLPTLKKQKEALKEVYRILKPGGIFFIHEVNTDNPLFKFYMNYIFPMTSRIDDDDTELWLSAKWIKKNPVKGFICEDILYFTFLPNFLPKFLFPLSVKLESHLEKITKGKQGAHYMALLKKS
ncbi:MAG: class I SAM-dependent methyltransferase [Spirochaetes bacterium]|nr:class I SAM-dependent methyltransferase [Spirochaetota bacterium]